MNLAIVLATIASLFVGGLAWGQTTMSTMGRVRPI